MISPIRIYCFCLVAVWTVFSACNDELDQFPETVQVSLPGQVDFNYHVKPILSDKCFACHGPDDNKRQAGLRLDSAEGAYAALESGATAIVPGKVRKSALYHRILSRDPETQMPPPEANLALTEYEKAVLVRWIDQGAVYKLHWSYLPPQQREPPRVEHEDVLKNPIDNFVLAKLEKRGLTFSPEADKTTLIRRLSFDLTGLPPTPEAVAAFLADDSANAYEHLVDRLLASPHYGERMAVDWLDIARYADSHGYHADGYRRMWPWRDWVIQAFNKNLPFDQFITWQLAGDLLPGAMQEQVLATAFHRNNPINSESGIVPEEYRVENVVDRTVTTAKAFMGLTVECARCHDHKYDAISQKEFYQLSAFFNNVDELGMVSNDGYASPTIPLMSEKVAEISAFIRDTIERREKELEAYRKKRLEAFDQKTLAFNPQALQTGLVAHYPLDKFGDKDSPNVVAGSRPAGFGGDLEVVTGRFGQALRFDDTYDLLTLRGIGDFERTQAFSMGAWIRPEKREDFAVIMGNAGGKNQHWRGYDLFLDSQNRPNVRLTHNPPDHGLHVASGDSVAVNTWSHILFTYDGSSRAGGIRIYLNGKEIPVTVRYDQLYKSIRTINDTLKTLPRDIRVGRSYQSDLDLGLFQGAIDEVRVYDRLLTAEEVYRLFQRGSEAEKPFEQLNAAEKQRLISHSIQRTDPRYQSILRELTALRQQEHELIDTVPEIMVMREMDPPRPSYVLKRGLYDAHGEEVFPGTPARVLPFPDSFPPNRLGLARWLVSPENPLTARVLVNRYWSQFFGTGIVETLEDFGNQGALPTHPELLDWLTVRFRELNWDLKALVRLIVTSATYRQSSVVTPEARAIDPNNELLARGPRYRLSSEMIRDNVLMASGLLVDKIGGPSVKTYQPEGLWSKTHFSRLLINYEADKDEKLYRRSLYTFIRRTAPPPTMTVLDAPDRSYCVVRRQHTSTPLQSLLLLNEPQMVEAARMLAERMIREGGDRLEEQLDFGFRLLTSRPLLKEELALMTQLYQEEILKYQADAGAAEALLAIGDYPRDPNLPITDVAAKTVVANIMMNYDEVYTKR